MVIVSCARAPPAAAISSAAAARALHDRLIASSLPIMRGLTRSLSVAPRRRRTAAFTRARRPEAARRGGGGRVGILGRGPQGPRAPQFAVAAYGKVALCARALASTLSVTSPGLTPALFPSALPKITASPLSTTSSPWSLRPP